MKQWDQMNRILFLHCIIYFFFNLKKMEALNSESRGIIERNLKTNIKSYRCPGVQTDDIDISTLNYICFKINYMHLTY